jgi:hypothetical protein
MAVKNDLTGIKFLITSGALAGTIGGWILLSWTGGASGQGGGSIQDPAVVDLINRPLPTLAWPNTQISAPGSDPNGSINIQPTAQPTLRSVADQPAPPPAAVTRSSK